MTKSSTKSTNLIKSFPGNNLGVISISREGLCCHNINSPSGLLCSIKYSIKNQFSYLYNNPAIILVLFTTLCVFLALLSLRMFDDNRLTSWQWVFADINLLHFTFLYFLLLLVSIWVSLIRISHTYSVFSLFIFSYLAGMLHWSSPELIVDAARYFTQAKHLELKGIDYYFSRWGSGVMSWTDLPLLPFIYGVMFKIFGESRVLIQVINTFFFSCTVVTTYYIGTSLWSHRVGINSALMFLSIPYLYTQVPLMMVDVPSMFFLTFAVLLYIHSMRNRGFGNAFYAAIAVAFAMLSKYTNWIMLSI